MSEINVAGQGRAMNTAMLPVIFTATIFLSAALLFFVQPLFAKLVLPQLGGAPAVWTTAMLFFQSVLILGYVYAHLLNRYAGMMVQIAVHGVLFGAALIFLPLAIPGVAPLEPGESVSLYTLQIFALGVGVPFLFLSANAPLIQSWFARSGRADAHDPYYLYGASNLGSLIALLGFPLAAEPLLGARAISLGWSGGFILLGLALAISAALVVRGAGPGRGETAAGQDAAPSTRQVGIWLVVAFIPSSMMLSVTSKISTDVGAVPLLWVIPLALYLVTFILTFRKSPLIPAKATEILALFGLIGLIALFSAISSGHLSLAKSAGMIAAFFLVALYFHGRLYDLRPHGRHLTLFYVVMSIGGALGGLFNSIVAPAAFSGLYEGLMTTGVGLIVLVAARLGQPVKAQLRAVGAAVVIVVTLSIIIEQMNGIGLGNLAILVGAGSLLTILTLWRRWALAAIVGPIAIFASSQQLIDNPLFKDRSFYGTHTVVERDGLRLYANGTTIHGAERLGWAEGTRPEPLYYYHPLGPLSQIMTSELGRKADSVGIVGLGIGAMSCFAQPGQVWDLYEIDEMVDRVARDSDWFHFMSECGPDMPTHIGDARIVLEGQDRQFDILVIDAFSSDAVPVHLLTREAMQLYLDRLAPDGVLVYHVSTRYYPLQIQIARQIDNLGLVGLHQYYQGGQSEDGTDSPSRVVVVARSEAGLGTLTTDARWERMSATDGRIWTDDYANLIGLLFE